jgi:hypothetical protein
MCPVCVTFIAITVASTSGAGAIATALAVRLRRSFTNEPNPEAPTERTEART